MAYPRLRQDLYPAHSRWLILERKDEFRTPTVVVVVDRTELEGQLKGWVERLLGEMQQQDIAVWCANSEDELRDLLKTDKRGLILSMIHKFEGRLARQARNFGRLARTLRDRVQRLCQRHQLHGGLG